MNQVAIVTDSTSDISPQAAAELGVTVVPLFVIFGEKSYRDYIDLSRDDFYDRLAHDKALPITSQPTSQMFEEAFAPLVAAGADILCITLSKALSGTINAATSAAAQFPDASISLFDSMTVAGGLQLQVLHARELAAQGKPVCEIVSALEADRAVQSLYATLPDLSHVVRTGRIGKAQAALGTLMKIVPVLRLKDGVVEAEAQVRTFARAQTAMVDAAMRRISSPANARIMVMHTRAPQIAQQMAKVVRERLGTAPRSLELLEAGPVIATHAGAGAVGIFTVDA